MNFIEWYILKNISMYVLALLRLLKCSEWLLGSRFHANWPFSWSINNVSITSLAATACYQVFWHLKLCFNFFSSYSSTVTVPICNICYHKKGWNELMYKYDISRKNTYYGFYIEYACICIAWSDCITWFDLYENVYLV